MNARAWLAREVREMEAAEMASLAAFDPWRAVADVVRGVLREREARREREREARAVVEALSEGAWRLVRALDAAGGTMFAFDVPEPVSVITELREAGLVSLAMSYDEAGEAAEPVVTLRYDVDLPGT